MLVRLLRKAQEVWDTSGYQCLVGRGGCGGTAVCVQLVEVWEDWNKAKVKKT